MSVRVTESSQTESQTEDAVILLFFFVTTSEGDVCNFSSITKTFSEEVSPSATINSYLHILNLDKNITHITSDYYNHSDIRSTML